MDQAVLKALREKRDAEKIMIANDYKGARDKLRKAKELCPDLANVESMLAVCDILCAADTQIPGCGTDHYWVLRVAPSCPVAKIKSRYQKLASLLQPIHHTFPGTELALKLIQVALSVLSNGESRSAFNLKRGGSLEQYMSLDIQAAFNHNVSQNETVITGENSGATKFLSETTTLTRPDLPGYAKRNTQHEPNQLFGDVYSQSNISTDVAILAESVKSSKSSHSTSSEPNLPWPSKDVVRKRSNQDFYDFMENRNSEFFNPGQIWAASYKADLHHHYRYARVTGSSTPAVSVTWLKPVPVSSSERRWCDIGLPVACGSFELNPEMSNEVSDTTVLAYKCSWVSGPTEERFEIYPKKGEVWALYMHWNLDEWSYDPDAVRACKFEFVELLSDFSKYLGAEGAWLEKVSGFRSIFQRKTIGGNPVICRIPPGNVYIFSHNVPSYKFLGGEIDGVVEGMLELDQTALPDDMFQNVTARSNNAQEGQASISSGPNPSRGPPSLKQSSESDPDPLTPSRSPNDFAVGQVWAAYSRKDLMPRQYARIDNITSENQVCVTLLEPLPIQEYKIDLKKKSLPVVCGMFKASGTSVCLQMSKLSYLVRCQDSISISNVKSLYTIYPLKGEIWAMYKNWSDNWSSADREQYKCQIVQILSDFREGDAIRVAMLREVKGCLTFFHTQEYEGFLMTHTVPRLEVLRFSHQIPYYKVPGIGSYGLPESCWHLEPNALPPRCRN